MMVSIICKELFRRITRYGLEAPCSKFEGTARYILAGRPCFSVNVGNKNCYSDLAGKVPRTGLLDMLKDGGNVVIAEGYMWEIERRGYLQFGRFGPEVVLDHPWLVKGLHDEFAHAGSDVIEAFTYYGYRERLKHFGREHEVEDLNRTALRIARGVADEHGKIMAGSISNTPLFRENDEQIANKIRDMFRDQIKWAVEEKANYTTGETFDPYGEAKLALQTILKYAGGCPAVIICLIVLWMKYLSQRPASASGGKRRRY